MTYLLRVTSFTTTHNAASSKLPLIYFWEVNPSSKVYCLDQRGAGNLIILGRECGQLLSIQLCDVSAQVMARRWSCLGLSVSCQYHHPGLFSLSKLMAHRDVAVISISLVLWGLTVASASLAGIRLPLVHLYLYSTLLQKNKKQRGNVAIHVLNTTLWVSVFNLFSKRTGDENLTSALAQWWITLFIRTWT